MTFKLQLKLLLWKNFTLRKRRKIRLLIELLWPLILFVILAMVRLKGLKTYHHQCHFDEKSLPSAGFGRFVQSFICTFNNTCHFNSRTQSSEFTSYNKSFINNLINDVQSTLVDNLDERRRGALSRIFEDISQLQRLSVNVLKAFKSDQLLKGFPVFTPRDFIVDENQFVFKVNEWLRKKNILHLEDYNLLYKLLRSKYDISHLSSSTFLNLLGNPSNFLCIFPHLLKDEETFNSTDKINKLCSLKVKDLRNLTSLIGSHVNVTALESHFNEFTALQGHGHLQLSDWQIFVEISKDIQYDLLQQDSIQHVIRDVTQILQVYSASAATELQFSNSSFENSTKKFQQAFAAFQRVICGGNNLTAEELFTNGETSTYFDELRDQLKDKDSEKALYIYDNSTSKECNEIMKTLEETKLVGFLWNQIKPFIRGKVLYAPDTPATRKLIEIMNETFAPIENLITFANLWKHNYSEQIRSFFLNKTNQNFLKDLFTDDSEGNLLDILLNNTLIDILHDHQNTHHLFLPLNSSVVRQNFEKYFDSNFSQTWNETLITLNNVIFNISLYLSCFETKKFVGVSTEREIEKYSNPLIKENKLWAGIVFVDFPSEQKDENLPEFITYKLRFDADKVDSTHQLEDRISRPGPRRRPSIDLKYFYYGFAYLQDMLEHAIISAQTGRPVSELPGISLQQMPYPCYIEDQFIIAVARTFPLFMTLAWVYSVSMIIKSIVYEKEERLKETMRVMGLSNGVHWMSWFIDSFLVMSTSSLCLTLILIYGKVLEYSSGTLIFFFLLSYAISTINFSFFLSTFFSTANLAAAAGGIIFFCCYLPYSFLVVWEEIISYNVKVLSSLIPNVAFGFGCAYFSHFEETAIGAQWNNIGKSPLNDDSYSMSSVIALLWTDSLLYGGLAWYIEALWPGTYGVPKPWYFPFLKSYWFGSKMLTTTTSFKYSGDSDFEMSLQNDEDFEEEPQRLPLGVSVKHLHKVYSNGKVAIDDLNLNFYEGQITSFLGHNGAGKTTTISIITGLFPPSAGTAYINGLDIRSDMDSIRKSLGNCPQHNVLFDQLSVYEHLWFYAKLKGSSEIQIEEEVNKMLQDLDLPHKRNEQAQHLSGGMKRKLSIASAFVGGSRTVVLDEPTAGVDPYSRRSIWDLLIKYKAGRTIILTTHFMDEADLLGDRIAIINNGKLVTAGSSLFLRTRFGNGYYLTLHRCKENSENKFDEYDSFEKEDSPPSSIHNEILIDDEGISDIAKKNGIVINPSNSNYTAFNYPLTKFIQKYVPDARLLEQIGSDIIYILPTDNHEHSVKKFEILFKDLEKYMKALNVVSYGLSNTTLEEIFLKVASNPNDGELLYSPLSFDDERTTRLRLTSVSSGRLTKPLDKKSETHSVPRKDSLEYSKVQHLVPHQLKALLIKRFHHSKRNKKGMIAEIILPVLFVSLAMMFTLILPPLEDEPPLPLNPWIYPTSQKTSTHTFYSNSNPNSDWSLRYEKQLLGPVGMGTKCVNRKTEVSECKDYSNNWTSFSNTLDFESPNCNCDIGTLQCSESDSNFYPSEIRMRSGDFLGNMTSRNISDFLLKTRHQFFKRRYGGFEFGIRNPFANQNISFIVDVLHDWINTLGNQSSKLTDNSIVISTLKGNLEDFVHSSSTFDNVRVWFNNKGWAASVSYVNAINNIILRASLEAKTLDFNSDWNDKIVDSSKYGIAAINHPMNLTKKQLDKEVIRQIGISLLHAICVVFAMSFVPASFVVFHIGERVTKIQHLHFVSGVNPIVYWISGLLWDFVMYLISASLCIGIFLAFDAQAYVSVENLPGLLLLMFLYGWGSIPLMYPTSFFFKVPSSAFVALSCGNLFIGIITTVTTFVLENFDDEELKKIGGILKEIFLIFPQYCLCRGLMDMATEMNLNLVLEKFGLESVRSRFAWDFLGKYFLALIFQGFFWFGTTIFIQRKGMSLNFSTICLRTSSSHDDDESNHQRPNGLTDMDEDVETERNRILNKGEKDSTNQNDVDDPDVLIVKSLSKKYSNTSNLAVNNLTFGVKKGECFGLLGVNGAGKTTTFKMLTGDTNPTFGDSFINGFNIGTQMKNCRQNMGYCPQFDALSPLLTGREHLLLYARLRGFDEESAVKVAESGLKKLGLIVYADRVAQTYSGGNKRKLSTAISLIGNPSLVFLDEPTSGMDPGSRRFLWNCILEMIRNGQSVILTSHSMEECEALCTRLAIMVNGSFRCLGSAQHLKNRFGSGYSLTLRSGDDAHNSGLDKIKEFILSTFPFAELKEEHYNQLTFQLPIKTTQLSSVFYEMEKARNIPELELKDYSITQTTLDEVFVRFASHQSESKVDE